MPRIPIVTDATKYGESLRTQSHKAMSQTPLGRFIRSNDGPFPERSIEEPQLIVELFTSKTPTKQ
jgi:hypothetical protein